MQKRIFALWGLAGTGKTTTLKLIAAEINRHFRNAVINIQLDPMPIGDIDKIIIIIGNIKIGITTKGDPNSELDVRIEVLRREGCTIIFVATRTSGTTVEIVEAFEKAHDYMATWVTNYQSGYQDEQEFLNQTAARDLVGLMRAMCEI